MRRPKHRGSKSGAPWVLRASMGAVIAFAAVAAHADCFVATAHVPLRLPGGEVQWVDQLTICQAKALTPVSVVHRVYADGLPVGMLVASRRPNEVGTLRAARIYLARGADGAMEILGYVVPGARRSETFAFEDALRRLAAARPGRAPELAWLAPAQQGP